MNATSFRRVPARGWARFVALMPRGNMLPEAAWASRHRAMLWILWAHVAFLPAFSLLRGLGPAKALGWTMPIALAGIAGELPEAGRRARSIAVVIGLLTASAVLVGAWGGQIEAHFHFFVMIAVLALYEDWLPFGLAIAYVVIEHGALGAISSRLVYSHGGDPWFWALIHGGFVLGAVGASVATWRLNEDMRGEMEAARRREGDVAKRFRLAFEGGVVGMALLTPDARFTQVNPALCQMLGYTESELVGRTFWSITHADDVVADAEPHAALVAGSVDVYETEKRYVHRDGRDVWARLGVSAVRDASGSATYFIAQMHDISEQRRVQEELAHRALHDHLTGLPNRALLQDRIRHALVRARRHSQQVALLFIDLDHFKLVNDGMGHRAGDEVLVAAAQRLEATVRAEDTVARLGGDEFTILCENTSADEAEAMATRVIDAFAAPFTYDGQQFHLSLSVGIRIADSPTITPDVLLRDADVALYSAKEQGRDRYEVFDPHDTRKINRLATVEALRNALRHGGLCLHYQPTVDLATGRIDGVEALLRWQHPERGMISPGEFIPLAEDSGLIVPIGEWVLNEACAQLVAWRLSGTVTPDVRMAVNVSARQLSDRDLPETVARALATSGLPAEALCLEITESAVVANPVIGMANLTAIKKQGVSLALDDFGVGFSSLSQIRDLPPVDVIKVDRSFTAGLGDNASDTAVITAVMSLARSLHLAVVAEGVEKVSQIGLLSALGCDIAQGFYFARPQPPDDVAATLARRSLPLPLIEAPAEASLVASE